MINFQNDCTAFPDGWHVETTPTIGLRDYFAAKVLPTLYHEYDGLDKIAKESYRMADAMLRAREGK